MRFRSVLALLLLAATASGENWPAFRGPTGQGHTTEASLPVTWGDGTTGVRGEVSGSNSLVGSTAADRVGAIESVIALSNGNYLVVTPTWDNGAAEDAGAVTWGSGTAGVALDEDGALQLGKNAEDGPGRDFLLGHEAAGDQGSDDRNVEI